MSELNTFASCFYSEDVVVVLSSDGNKEERLGQTSERIVKASYDSTHQIKKNKENENEKKLTFSAIINSSFLIEYMYYIFQGIYKIANHLDHSSQEIK
jgi:hypothetical protein